jgi:hypothetical protein
MLMTVIKILLNQQDKQYFQFFSYFFTEKQENKKLKIIKFNKIIIISL